MSDNNNYYSLNSENLWLFQLYHSENVYFVLVGVEVWTGGDLINVDASNPAQTLTDFRDYRFSNINPIHNNDNSHLIT